MTSYVDIWQLLAGLGLFLFAMQQLEEALSALAGRSFKIFLKTSTKHPLKGLFSGVILTAVLQSSSAVSLLLLAFVGAGILSMNQALPVIFGSNLGTTATGWLVVSLGFKLPVEDIALPLIGLGGIVLFFFRNQSAYFNSGRFLLSFGVIFLGLEMMKVSVEVLAQNLNLSAFAQYGHLVFLFVGALLTALIQSSSATMVIALSVLHTGLLPLSAAMAIVIGSNVGTTTTVFLGSLGGVPAKKQVAFAHFLFNLITAGLALLILTYLQVLITDVLSIEDPLVALVIFHSFFNLLGILLFLPFTRPLSHFLDKIFVVKKVSINQHLHLVTAEVPEAAIEALQKETFRLLNIALFLNLKALRVTNEKISHYLVESEQSQAVRIRRLSYPKAYLLVKQLEGEMLRFYAEIQKQTLDPEESQNLSKLMTVIQNTMHSVKGLKDIAHNILEFESRTSEDYQHLLHNFRDSTQQFYEALSDQIHAEEGRATFEEQSKLMVMIQQNYEQLLVKINAITNRRTLNEVSISTFFNVNRELYSSHKAILMGASDMISFLRESALAEKDL
ncbi:phosphate:Na+ symporter [Catalinimonas alkaloidigena]|uniref:Na/Pi cotransporter family protein n=1 Tax=Catalinimonas alkaloidigena TaxID=1075417 RepID=UPI0024071D67|nr:Na/Pi symporter [Catalinimonas alkaloidigena]MDF9796547.1 phosphate:Na+ symporter [Catalinimonas alkaloidigena]